MTDLAYDFHADREAARITMRRDFAAPRDLVWDCYTRAELLDRWYAPAPLTTETKTMDFREGGHWHFAMITPEGEHYWSRFDFDSITPRDAMTYRDGFSDAEGRIAPDLPRSEARMTFTEDGAGTTVRTVVQYASPEAVDTVIGMGLEAGLASTLSKLDELLADLAR